MKDSIKSILKIFISIILTISLSIAISYAYKVANDNVADVKISKISSEINKDNKTKKKVFKKYEDMVFWIEIKDTNINYPVMQKVGDNQYYLRKSPTGKYSYSGTPFLDGNIDINKSKNYIIYGHNLKNEKMFSTLEKYKSYSYMKKHKTINLKTENGDRKYEICACALVDGNSICYEKGIFENEESFSLAIEEITKNSVQITSTFDDISFKGELLTLSTCDYTKDDLRLLVIAVRCE